VGFFDVFEHFLKKFSENPFNRKKQFFQTPDLILVGSTLIIFPPHTYDYDTCRRNPGHLQDVNFLTNSNFTGLCFYSRRNLPL